MAINYVHPSVSSTITDNSTVYITATGTTKLFAVFTSEKGIDNEIQTITSVSEFIFNYGEPNMKLYGQAGYNITNWLNAGGVVYALRVLPEDAGYANAIVNIQAKTSKKEVLNADGNKVEVPHVTLRPCVTYATTNNNDKDTIESVLLKSDSSEAFNTFDGYKNHMLFAVIPKGRGKGYNDLGFRITLNQAYGSTYEFRLYDFEVTKRTETGSISTIQGPFLVSLDPDAMSISGSSLFIKDVIDSYCDYFKIIFNEDAYESLANLINPNVHPNRIDFLDGESRIDKGEYETYYNDATGKYEDVHMSVIKYIDGESTGIADIIDGADSIEKSIVDLDNDIRDNDYKKVQNTFERTKKVLSLTRGDAHTPTVFNSIVLDTNDKTIETTLTELADGSVDTLDAAYSKVADTDEDKAKLILNPTVDIYNPVDRNVRSLASAIDGRLELLQELYDYGKIGLTGDDTVITDFKNVNSNLSSIERITQVCKRYSNTAIELTAKLNSYVPADMLDSEKIDFVTEVVNEVKPIINGITEITKLNENTEVFADSKLSALNELLATIEGQEAILTDVYATNTDIEGALNDTDDVKGAWSNVSNLLGDNALYLTINLALLEYKISMLSGLKGTLDGLKSKVVDMTYSTSGDFNKTNITNAKVREKVQLLEVDLDSATQFTYKTNLQKFDGDGYISLQFGTDGSIENISYKDKAVESLIINGYRGGIDTSLEDKEKWPIDMVLDANYSANVKSAIASLCTEVRDDFMGILDTENTATPNDVLTYRRDSVGFNNFRLAIFTQHFVVTDTEYTGNNIEVTPTYFLASKIPANDNANGIHWNFVGPRRGTITGYKTISFLPNPNEREQLYNAQVNYVQQDQTSTRFNSQLTSQRNITALSNISCVRTLLRIQRDVENLMKNYQFEFNDDVTITNAQTALNSYLNQWISNRACDSITGTVYASDYDRQQKLLRVKVELVFNSIIERIAIDLIVNA